jgi:EAL domain-containing protein (putative c-di-GMP-specific phosphodiesterase class I)
MARKNAGIQELAQAAHEVDNVLAHGDRFCHCYMALLIYDLCDIILELGPRRDAAADPTLVYSLWHKAWRHLAEEHVTNRDLQMCAINDWAYVVVHADERCVPLCVSVPCNIIIHATRDYANEWRTAIEAIVRHLHEGIRGGAAKNMWGLFKALAGCIQDLQDEDADAGAALRDALIRWGEDLGLQGEPKYLNELLDLLRKLEIPSEKCKRDEPFQRRLVDLAVRLNMHFGFCSELHVSVDFRRQQESLFPFLHGYNPRAYRYRPSDMTAFVTVDAEGQPMRLTTQLFNVTEDLSSALLKIPGVSVHPEYRNRELYVTFVRRTQRSLPSNTGTLEVLTPGTSNSLGIRRVCFLRAYNDPVKRTDCGVVCKLLEVPVKWGEYIRTCPVDDADYLRKEKALEVGGVTVPRAEDQAVRTLEKLLTTPGLVRTRLMAIARLIPDGKGEPSVSKEDVGAEVLMQPVDGVSPGEIWAAAALLGDEMTLRLDQLAVDAALEELTSLIKQVEKGSLSRFRFVSINLAAPTARSKEDWIAKALARLDAVAERLEGKTEVVLELHENTSPDLGDAIRRLKSLAPKTRLAVDDLGARGSESWMLLQAEDVRTGLKFAKLDMRYWDLLKTNSANYEPGFAQLLEEAYKYSWSVVVEGIASAGDLQILARIYGRSNPRGVHVYVQGNAVG